MISGFDETAPRPKEDKIKETFSSHSSFSEKPVEDGKEEPDKDFLYHMG